jgi:hypothetical protein
MKIVTFEAVEALLNNTPYKKGNTEVEVIGGDSTILRLYGHKIAYKDITKQISIDSCGYMTNTTKERLNGIPGVCIRQKAGKWYLNGTLWDGKIICIN